MRLYCVLLFIVADVESLMMLLLGEIAVTSKESLVAIENSMNQRSCFYRIIIFLAASN